MGATTGDRALEAEVLSADGRTVEIRALTYNVPDTYRTSWRPGCATRALQAGPLPIVCWSHDRQRIVGAVVGFRDHPGYLNMTIRLADPDRVPDVRMVQALLEPDMLPALGVSIGYSHGQQEPDPLHRGVMRYTDATIREVSFVGVPSVPGARVLAVRSARPSRRTSGPTGDELTIAMVEARARLAMIAMGKSPMHQDMLRRVGPVWKARRDAAHAKKIRAGEAMAKSWEMTQWQRLVDSGARHSEPAAAPATYVPGSASTDTTVQPDYFRGLEGQTFPAVVPRSEPPQDLINAGVAAGLSPQQAREAWERRQS